MMNLLRQQEKLIKRLMEEIKSSREEREEQNEIYQNKIDSL